MKQPKTLKDIEVDKVTMYKYALSKDLRQEAIKWVKHLEETKQFGTGAIAWIISFFNLTEEDLK